MTIIYSAAQALKNILSPQHLAQLAQESKLIARQRELSPEALVLSLVSALSGSNVDSIAELHRTYNAFRGEHNEMSYKPYHNQLIKKAFPRLMKTLTLQAMRQLVGHNIAAQRLNQFKDVLIQDGSSLTLHPKLASIFPGRFPNAPAAVECHMRMSLLTQTPTELTITADTASERAHLPTPILMRNTLLMADAGYFDLDYFSELDTYGGFFLAKGLGSLNPRIVEARNGRGKELPKFVGKQLKELTRSQSRSDVWELQVRWPDGVQFRLIRFWHRQERKYIHWVTNLDSSWSAEELMQLYRARWQVELLFKEWKSHTNLRKFNTGKAEIVEGLIWTSLLTLIVSRFCTSTASRIAGQWLSWMKTAKTSGNWIPELVRALCDRYPRYFEECFAEFIQYLSRNAKRDQQSKGNKIRTLEHTFAMVDA